SASIPFGPLAHLLPEGPSPTGGLLDLLRGITDKLVTRARGGRLLIGVDDAHLLDAASATLVHQLAATGRAFVLLTLRTGEAVPDPITALWKEGVAERLEVQALSEVQTGELVADVLGGHVDGPT